MIDSAIPITWCSCLDGFRKGLNPSYELQWSKAGAAAQAAPSKAERGAEAKAKGYEGEMCGECGHFFAGAKRHVHEVRYVWINDGVFVILNAS